MYVLGYIGYTRDTRLGLGRRSPFAKTGLDFDGVFEFRDGEVPFSMFPLGFFGHDASAALVRDGVVLACASEERFTRMKHSLNLAGNTLLPRNAVRYCLDAAGISMDEVDVVAHYCDFTTESIERRAQLVEATVSAGTAQRVRESYNSVYEAMMSGDAVRAQFARMTGRLPARFLPVNHHLAHAASAFYPSGFQRALILTIDGTGETDSGMLAVGTPNGITTLRTVPLPASLGTLYLLITVFLGYHSLGDEYKVMGLASYGDPSTYRPVFNALVTLGEDGTYATPWLAREGLKDFFVARLGPARAKHEEVERRHADIAAALQESLHRAVLHTLSHARRETGERNLCLAGGVALNCTMNGVIARSGLFDRIFVQPAAGDEGCSVGAALYAYSLDTGPETAAPSAWDHVCFGPSYDNSDIAAALAVAGDGIAWTEERDIAQAVASELSRGSVAGWFQGRMEFGPRALGNRSILGDPRDAGMKDRINAKVKRREAFRPFAPAVLEERAAEYFDMTGLDTSPYMLFTVPVLEHKRQIIPAVTHVDGSSRIQTVSHRSNPRFRELIEAFGNMTGVPVVLNTSFNVRNEPIVCSPGDALRCFQATEIDCVALGDVLVRKRGPA